MKKGFRAPVSTIIAVSTGVVVLLGYFLPIPLLANLRSIFLRWFVILAAVAFLVGTINLASVHWKKITQKQSGVFYSFILLVSLVITFTIAVIFGPTSLYGMWIFNYIQIPVESSLMALLAVVLVYSIFRLLRRRVDMFVLIFTITATITLLGTIVIPGLDTSLIAELKSWIIRVPSVAGARGILLGIALGTVATGLRLLIGADRPYGG